MSAIQWLPHRKGVVAVACTEALSHTERVARAGRPANAYILIWNFKVRWDADQDFGTLAAALCMALAGLHRVGLLLQHRV